MKVDHNKFTKNWMQFISSLTNLNELKLGGAKP